ncbi:hypothetical protein QN277_000535 [Acacia crassicarpa]|uniref:F-box domain-containing protein n=1 Tax=Acacia crassicarpa TaxID=499986 RepID=A0AAE1N6A4_9FABA|nr:hypothetical protein QN277_000535 [Acacia crassicarpa]
MEKLSDELRIEILYRLPIKSLACLKCVSKSWLSLISDPNFTKLHFQRSPQNYTYRFPYRVRAEHDRNSYQQMRAIDLNASLCDDSADITFNNFPSGYDEILASCRGFLLLQHNKIDKLLVWNPTTSEQKQILLPRKYSFELHGFCYDESTDDYLIALATKINLDMVLGFRVFSVRTNSWKKEIAFNCGEIIRSRFPGLLAGVAVNGVIYWLVYFYKKEARRNATKIIAFDIKANNVSEVVPKHDNIIINLTLCDLRTFGESLALFDFKGFKEIEVWEMKEDGVRSSWTKLMSIPSCAIRLRAYFSPLCLTKDGKLVTLDNPSTLSKWSEQGKEEEVRKCNGYDLVYESFAATPVYTETLLSLPSTQ